LRDRGDCAPHLIEAVLTQYLREQARAQVEARDLELINKAADELNTEVEDVLRYQATQLASGGDK
jgi:hypothetical protein